MKTTMKKTAAKPVMKNGGKMKKYRNGGKTSSADSMYTNTTSGQISVPKKGMGGKMKKYSAGGRVVPTVDNSMMSKGGKVMAKKAMGGKMGKKAC